MSRVSRAAGYILLGAVVMALILAVAFFFLTRTRAGVNLVSRFAIERLERSIEGRLRMDSVTTRTLLGGATIHGLSITDVDGRPFVQADSVHLGYRLRSFLAGEIVFDRATLFRPVVVIEQLPGDTLWNFEKIFPPGPPEPDEERSLIEIARARVIDGTAIVRTPYEPEPGETPGADRRIVREVPGGLARELRFDRINGTFPRIIWETPAEPGKLIEVATLSTRGFVWEDPFVVDNLRGSVTIRDSLITFDLPAFAMPGSRGSAIGEVITADDRVHYDVRINADQVAFTDLEWLYPPLAIEGGGTGTFRMQTQPVGTLYLVEDARLRAPGTNLAGTFGIVVDDTVYFTQVNLRASPLNLELLHQIIPDAPILEGLLVGTVEVEGPLSSLSTKGELHLATPSGARTGSSLRWSGALDLLEPYGATALTAELEEFDLARLDEIWPELALRGTLSARIEATGALDRGLSLNTGLAYRGLDGDESLVDGGGTLTWRGGRPEFDLTLNAEPLDFAGLATLAPVLGEIDGAASGLVAVSGRLDDLELMADLLADGGRLQLQGNLALDGETPRYRAEGVLDDVVLDRLLTERIPRGTSFTARFALEGEGFDPRTARSDLSVEVDSARVAQIDLSSANLGLRVADGLAHVDSLVVTAALGALRASGALGLDSTRTGTVELLVNADSLVALQAILFPDAPALVDPDSTHGRIEGSARIEAELRGSLGALEIDADARLRRPVVSGAEAQQIVLSFSASGVGRDSLLAYHLTASADSLDIYGQKLDRATAVADFHHGGGWFQLEASSAGPLESAYHIISGFRPMQGGVELDLRELRARTGSEEWGLAEPARLRVGTDGLQIDELLFSRTTGAGRVLARGRLPWTTEDLESSTSLIGAETADLRLEFQRLPLFSLRADDDPAALGVADITGSVVVTGTALTPRIRVDLALGDTRVGGLRIEQIIAGFDYVDQRLDASLEARMDGRTILTGTGRIPIDLRLMPVEERRLARPLDLRLRADGVPAAILRSFIDGFRAIEGEIDGIIALTGTTLDPTLGGQLTLRDGAATWIDTGVRYRGVAGTARVLGEQVVNIDLTARTTDGSATFSGIIDFETLTDPTFDLLILARNFRAVNRRDVEMTASGEVRLEGSYSRPVIEGRVRVDRGTLFLDEVWRQYQIVTLDDPLLLMMDTAFVFEEHILDEAQSAFIRNLSVDADVEIQRGSWLRSRQLNVEVSGRLRVEMDPGADDGRNDRQIRLTGTLNAVRGTYELYVAEELPARRFMVRGGTVDFDGTPGINPGFDITAGYRVRTPDRQALNVLAVVTGNLESPRVSLRSDDDDSISESDLLSYLIFGRPTYALAGSETRQLDTYLTGLGAGIIAPAVLSYAALFSEAIATNFGVADYVSIMPTEADTLGFADGGRAFDPFSALGRAQVEVGKYIGDAWYIAATRRFGQGAKLYDLGVRLEWRIAPTWTAEFFIEDRFARYGRFGVGQPLESRKVGGLFLFREWGF